MSYEKFEKRLKSAGSEEKIKVALEGLLNNVFTRNLNEIHHSDLSTLEMQNPEAYETIRDKKIREALIKSKLFALARWKSPNAEEDIEIEFDSLFGHRLLYTLNEVARDHYEPELNEAYGGEGAVKTFLRSLYIITKMEKEAWGQFERMGVIRNVLKESSAFLHAKGHPLSPSRIEEFFRRVRVDSPLMETMDAVAKSLGMSLENQ